MLDALIGTQNVSAQDLTVVSVAHTAIHRATGRMRYEPLADRSDLDLTVLAPSRWHEYGRDFTPDPHQSSLKLMIEPIRLPKVGPAKWYLHHYPRFGEILDRAAPDVIHLWEEPWSLVALQAVRWRDRNRRDAAIVIETDQNIHRRLPVPFEHIRRYVLARTDMLLYRHREALDVSRACGYSGLAQLLEYGVDSAIFRPSPPGAPRPARPLTLGYVGRLIPEKGLMDVVEAMARAEIGARFLLLGEGAQKEALQKRAEALKLDVQFFAPRPPSGVAEFIGDLDALVLMSRTTATWKEQFGRVIMEAQACGVPVIGSSSGSIPSVTGRGGWVVEEGNVDELASLLRRLAAEPETLAQAGRFGLENVERRFTFDAVANTLLDGWQEAARARRPQ